MSALSLILGDRGFRTKIGVLTLDAAESITHNITATPTKNPIEAKSGDPLDNFTDNIRLQNTTLNIDAIMTEAPISILGSAFNVFTGLGTEVIGDKVQGPTSSIATQAFATGVGSLGGIISNRQEGDLTYPKKAFEYLVELRDNRQPFVVVTRLRRYENMVLTNLSVPQVSQTGLSLRFSATFEQIRIVNTAIVQIPEQTTNNASAVTKQNLGKQANKNASDSTGSLAKSLADSLGITTRGSGV